MFTGLVEAVGTVVHAAGQAPRCLTLAAPLAAEAVAVGDSVAVDGCCLTVVRVDAAPAALSFEAATETLSRTTLGRLQVGHRVHLERAMRLSDRLGGHLVAGHIDAVGHLRSREMRGSALYLEVAAPPEVMRLTAARGSITLAGVSLTVTATTGGSLWVALIPHTVAVTTLGALAVGDEVNLEADLLARYVERLLRARQPAPQLTPDVAAPPLAPS